MDLEPLGLNGNAAPAGSGSLVPPPEVKAQSGPLLPAFYGKPTGPYQNAKEAPWHRSAAFMFARGASLKEVAEAHEKSKAAVGYLLKNKWFQDLVTQLMADLGGRDIMDLFRGEGVNTFVALVELRDDPKISSAVRKSVCTEILDRAFGKPLQRVEQTGPPVSSDPVAEVERLEALNERLRPEP
jgi:hypothetical protein